MKIINISDNQSLKQEIYFNLKIVSMNKLLIYYVQLKSHYKK